MAALVLHNEFAAAATSAPEDKFAKDKKLRDAAVAKLNATGERDRWVISAFPH